MRIVILSVVVLLLLIGLTGLTALFGWAVGMIRGLIRTSASFLLIVFGGLAFLRAANEGGEPLMLAIGGLMIVAGAWLLLASRRSAADKPVIASSPPAPREALSRIAQDRRTLERAMRDEPSRWWRSERKMRRASIARRHAALGACWPIMIGHAPDQTNRISVMRRRCDEFVTDYLDTLPTPARALLYQTIIEKLPQRVSGFLDIAELGDPLQRAEDMELLLRFCEQIAADAERFLAERRTKVRADFRASVGPVEPWQGDPFAP